MAKSTDAEMEQRVTEVYDLLLTGTSRPAILAHASKWEVDARSVDTYIRRAKAEIKKQAAVERDNALGLAFARLELLFQRTLSAKDYRGALAVLRELNALADLYPMPQPQTIRLLGMDAQKLAELERLFEANGLNPADVFNSMFVRLANAAKEKP